MSTAHVHQPKSKCVSIYDLSMKRLIHFKNPYGVKAKKAYKRLLDEGAITSNLNRGLSMAEKASDAGVKAIHRRAWA
eukprot:SAG22_NODE_4335_length_1300_cov_5.228976_2_plen_77_part_00